MRNRRVATHRAETPSTNSIAAIAKAINGSGLSRQAVVVATASGLVLTGGIAANAAQTSGQGDPQSSPAVQPVAVKAPLAAAVTAEDSAKVSFETVAADSKLTPAPAPVRQVTPQSSETAALAQPKPAAPVNPPANTAPEEAQATKAPDAASSPSVASGSGAEIVAAAYAQIGVSQDCTALVTNALAAVGINFRGWPNEYKTLGSIIPASQAQPGDLVYYPQNGSPAPYNQHVAVYVGNGMAVHGGWAGGTTALASVNISVNGQTTPPQAYIAIGR